MPVKLLLRVLILATLTLICGPDLLSNEQAAIQQSGLIVITLLDPFDAKIIDTEVRLTSPDLTLKSKANGKGEFRFNAPPGIYRIETDIPGYFPFRRAEIRLAPDQRLVLTIRPVLKVRLAGIRATKKGAIEEFVEYEPSPKTHDLTFGDCEMKANVQYKRQTLNRHNITFYDATLTFDAITITARKIRFTRSTAIFEATDLKRLEDGSPKDYPGTKATLKCQNNQPALQVNF